MLREVYENVDLGLAIEEACLRTKFTKTGSQCQEGKGKREEEGERERGRKEVRE